jgi:tryptophanyl-tRNA synthetase
MKKRILTGDNVTGNLHVGHYVGSLENRVELQNDYDTILILADMHALCYPKYIANPKLVGDHVLEIVLDYIAAGIDPEKVTIFAESQVPEIYELSIILSTLSSYGRILRNPTIKDEIREKDLKDTYSLGFLNFPVMMAADILAVNADLVPVGEDQVPHLELTRELARKFNNNYKEVFTVPEPLIGKVGRLVGLDGNAKMSKSLGNCIYLDESTESLKEKVMSMYTDPNRIRATDPGKVEGNPVFIYHDAFNPNKEEVAELKDRYKQGKVGDVEVKQKLFVALEDFIAPMRERRALYESKEDILKDLVAEGSKRVRELTTETLDKVKDGLYLPRY